ncbi:MAG: hypothetical protein Q9206_004361 [Seirophora lacunosa]
MKCNDHVHRTSALNGSADGNTLCPIHYIYDYLPFPTAWLTPRPVSLSSIWQPNDDAWPALPAYEAEGKNSFGIHATAAQLPLHTGLDNFRQNKHWHAIEDSTKELLKLFAEDRLCGDVMLSKSLSLSTLAKEQLKSDIIDTYSRFIVYTFPEADEERIRLVAQSVILIFIFDDTWESAAQETIVNLRHDFESRLRGTIAPSEADTPLERRIHDIRHGFLASDEVEGNGGADVLETLIKFFYHAAPPHKGFSSVCDYLDYRWEDVANDVDQSNPCLRRLLHHIGDQISIVNDMASYDKEKRHFDTGRAKSMINLVHVIATLERVDAQTAKAMAYAWQLSTENAILEDLQALKRQGELSSEEWRFVDACLTAASGHLFASVVMARYGGEKTRVV